MPGNTVCPWPKLGEPIVKGTVNKDGTFTGRITEIWMRCLLALHNRTGGSSGVTTLLGMPGEIRHFAGPSANIPSGWLQCDGSSVTTAAYPDLFAAIGYTWGGAGANFSLPDYRGRMLMGVSGGHAIGTTGGAETTTLVTANLASHSHGVTDPGHTHVFTATTHTHAVTDGGHTHPLTDAGHTHNAAAGSFVQNDAGTEYLNAAGDKGTVSAATASAVTGATVASNTTGITNANTVVAGSNASSTTGLTTNSAGSGTAATTVSPFGTAFAIIKT